jgi:surfeit locus 1 family protein
MSHFKHLILPGVILLSLAVGFAMLGFWQLGRAEQNRGLQDGFARGAAQPAVELAMAAADPVSVRYRPITARGHYRAEQQILLDNLTHQGQAGYQVLTPFDIGGEALLLVNRGWVPADPDRNRLPDVALASRDAETVTGRIDLLPRTALSLGANQIAAAAPVQVLSFPDLGEIAAALGAPVHPFQLLLDPQAPWGYVRDWQPAGVPPERNTAYAVQWFGLAGLAVVIAAILGVRTMQRGGQTNS